MSRIIKFRGIELDTTDFVYGDLIQDMRDGRKAISTPDDLVNVKHGTVGQFTGLHDKNGVEIYEGDIIVLPYCNNDVCTLELDGCNYYLKGKNSRYELGGYQSKYFEVIGNIHERSEEL